MLGDARSERTSVFPYENGPAVLDLTMPQDRRPPVGRLVGHSCIRSATCFQASHNATRRRESRPRPRGGWRRTPACRSHEHVRSRGRSIVMGDVSRRSPDKHLGIATLRRAEAATSNSRGQCPFGHRRLRADVRLGRCHGGRSTIPHLRGPARATRRTPACVRIARVAP